MGGPRRHRRGANPRIRRQSASGRRRPARAHLVPATAHRLPSHQEADPARPDHREGHRAQQPGPQRTILATTPEGRRALRHWLGEPVDHVREVRSVLLLKLALIDRIGGDAGPLLTAQHGVLAPKLEALQCHRDEAEGFELTLATWRLESIKAVVHFLESTPAPVKQLRARAPRRARPVGDAV